MFISTSQVHEIRRIADFTSSREIRPTEDELDIRQEESNEITASHLADKTAVLNARVEILQTWYHKQESHEAAYTALGEALIRAGLRLIARKVLNYPPPMTSSKRKAADDDCGSKRFRTEQNTPVSCC